MRVFLAVIAVICVALAVSLSFFFIKSAPGMHSEGFNNDVLKTKEIGFRAAKVEEIDSTIDAAMTELGKAKTEGEKIQDLKEKLEEARSNVNKLKQVLPKDENNRLIEDTLALLPSGSYSDIPQI